MDCRHDNIVLSTAAFCLWDITPDKKLAIAKELDFSQIQIALSTSKMVEAFISYLESRETLTGFKNIVIHAPWCGISYGDNRRSKRTIDGVKRILEMVHVEAVIFRVDSVPTIEVLNSLIAEGIPVCLENSEKDLGCRLFEYYAEHSTIPLALNINRAEREKGRAQKLFKCFADRISRVMVSGFNDEMGRMPLISTQQYPLLDTIRGFDGPVVIEGLFDPEDLNAIRMEREHVAKFMRYGESA